jgi:hypothetical protein
MALTWKWATEEDWQKAHERFPANPDDTMNGALWTIVLNTMLTTVGTLDTDEAIAEYARRIDYWQRLFGPSCSGVDTETGESVPRPITREDVQACKGLETNVFPLEPSDKWYARIGALWAKENGATIPNEWERMQEEGESND